MPFETLFLDRLKVKVTHEGHIKYIVRAILSTFMHGCQNNFAQVFFLRSRSVSLKHLFG